MMPRIRIMPPPHPTVYASYYQDDPDDVLDRFLQAQREHPEAITIVEFDVLYLVPNDEQARAYLRTKKELEDRILSDVPLSISLPGALPDTETHHMHCSSTEEAPE